MSVTTTGQVYLPRLYICGGSCTQEPPDNYWVSLSRIMFSRPSNCRYVVIELWRSEAMPLWYEVWDLYHDTLLKPGQALRRPPSIVLYSGSNFDALVMKTLARYGKDEP